MFIASSKTKDLGKALMEHIGASPEDPMKIYRIFLAHTLSSNVSHSNLSTLHTDLLGQFYRLSQPTKKPAEFNLSNTADVSRLERAISANIVLLGGSGRRGEYTKLHDTRIFNDADDRGRVFAFVVVQEGPGEFCLLEGDPDYDVRLSEWQFIAHCSKLQPPACLLQKMRDLAGEEEEVAAAAVAGPHHEHDASCNDPMALCAAASSTRELLPGPILLASHVRGRLKGASYPERQSFAVLGVLKRDSEVLENCAVLCVTADKKHVYLPFENFARRILDRSCKLGRGETREKFPPQELDATVGAEKEEKKNFTSERVLGDRCECAPCRRGREFSDNLRPGGRQGLYRTRMSSFDLARALGLLNEETEFAINEACRVSQAAWDVESMTVEDECGSREETGFPYEQVSRTTQQRKVLARQVPLLVSWSDYTMHKEGLDPFVYEYDEKDPEKMTARFLADVSEMRDKASATKQRLLAPLLSWCDAMEKAHLDHFLGGGGLEDEDEERQVRAAFRGTVWGRFQAGLKSLVRRYLLWAFNGEGYDMVILGSAIVTHLKNAGKCNVRMRRDGNKIPLLGWEQILFLETKKLLSPDASLSSTAKMCGLKIGESAALQPALNC